MVLGPACSEETKAYFARLRDAAETCYRVARAARAQGFDPELDVEIDLAEDLATRVERLLKDYGVTGVANRIRELSRDHDREEVSILVAKELAHRAERSDSPRRKEEAIGRAVRVGLAILTEGVLVAPLEGFTGVKVKSNPDGSTYADLYFAGPIRSAGGTGQALSVLIADVARRELGVGRYQPTREEIERFKEEVQLYRRVQHLQYTPTDKEVSLIVSNCPVAVNGEGTEDEEISGHRDLPRIETNRVRGGACLVVADGLCLKAPKIQKHVTRLKIDGWEFIDAYLKAKAHADVKEETDPSVDPSDTFIQQLVAGRPVLCHPSRPGGFRLRYGRARSAGLAALAIHPATMYLLNQFIAVGTQIKTERPGKAAAVTPCDALESPIVLLRSGDLVAVDDVDRAKRVRDEVEQIVDLGEILVPFGEFLENNHVLMPGAYAIEWYREELRRAAGELPANWRDPTPEEAIELSARHRVGLHPNYNLFWHDLSVDRLRALRAAIVAGGRYDGRALRIRADPETKRALVELGVLHHQGAGECVVEACALPMMRCLGLTATAEGIAAAPEPEATDPLAYVSALAGFPVRARGPTRIGARMGRPEKAAPRKMQPAPHVLFPLGKDGGAQRLVKDAVRVGQITVEVGLRTCTSCRKRWFLPKCTCGGHTVPHDEPRDQTIDLAEAWEAALARVHGSGKAPDVKGVQGVISASRTPEMLERGILRARHEVFVFKDGTSRFDMTNLPLTHFKPSEVGMSVEGARSLGYARDVHGRPLASADQLLELKVQDVIVSKEGGEYLVRVARFVDDLLQKVYGMEPFYRASGPEDLVGHSVVTLAPHTSAGVLARIIGYTPARGAFGHPYLVAARRRNCDGDEDSVILLLDALLNFSRAFLPESRGGLMDAPLVLSTRIDPNEIDKEAHNLDVGASYPLEVYEAALRFAHPKTVESLVDLVGRRVGSVLQYEGFSYTHEGGSPSAGPHVSTYTEGSMEEKLSRQLDLAKKIRAVDPQDVVTRIVVHHLLPDMIGNMGAFSRQEFRCTKCGGKYRRLPLQKRCTKTTPIAGGQRRTCGGNIVLTVHQSSVRKYLELTKKIADEYDVSNYLRQRIALMDEAMRSLFTNDRDKDVKLDDFF